NITLQFDLSRNIDAAAQDVQAMIGRTARSLPPQMPAPPAYQKANPGDQSVILLVLRSPTLPLSMLDEYAQQPIAQRLSMVDEVAHVFDGVENDKSGAWQSGERCVMISIRKQPGTNVVEVVDRVKALLPSMREQLPAAMTLNTRNDRSITIRDSVSDVKKTL